MQMDSWYDLSVQETFQTCQAADRITELLKDAEETDTDPAAVETPEDDEAR